MKILEIKEPMNRPKSSVRDADYYASSILLQMESEIEIVKKEIHDLKRKLRKYDQVDADSEVLVDNVFVGLCPSPTEYFKSRKRSLLTSPEASPSPIKTPRFSSEYDLDTEIKF